MTHLCGCGLCSIQIHDISVTRGGDAILEHVSFDAHCGELTALIGVNGAGKTTLLKAILNEIHHTGNVRYLSHDGTILDKITVGYVPQKLEFDLGAPVSVLDFLLAGRTNRPVWLSAGKRDKAAVHALLEQCGAHGLASRTLGELSGGELQRVMLAQALYPAPALLILDEPVSGVDTLGIESFYALISRLIRNTHMAVLMVSHDLNLMRRKADKVILLHHQVLRQGTPEEVFASKEYDGLYGGGTHA